MKPGDKYIIELDKVVDGPLGKCAFVKNFKALVFDQYGLDHLQKYDPKKEQKEAEKKALCGLEVAKNESYKNGLEDAWELLRSMWFVYKIGELKNLFELECASDLIVPRILENFTALESKEKIEAYEKEKNAIRVGDEVQADIDGTLKFVVTKISTSNRKDGEKYYSGIKPDGLSAGACESCLKKTGRHFDLSAFLGGSAAQEK